MSKCILVIDDEPEIVNIMGQVFQPEGYTVLTAATAAEGLKFYDQYSRDVVMVLLDYMLPDMNGELVFECMQRINPDVRVILMTGCDDRVASGMHERGLRGFLQKPFFLEDLKKRVHEELDTQ